MVRRITLSLLCSLWMLLAFPAAAGTLPIDSLFKTSGQSIWGPGSSFADTWERYIGSTWDKSGSVGDDPKLYGSTHGTIGLDFGFGVDTGSVNVSVPINGTLDYPDISLSAFTVKSSISMGLDSGTLKVSGPNVIIWADFKSDFYAKLGFKASWWIFSGDFVLYELPAEGVKFDREFVPKTVMGFSISEGSTSDGTSLTLTDSKYFQLPKTLEFPIGDSWDLLGVIDVGYDIVKVELTPGVEISRTFTFTPVVQGKLRVEETGEEIEIPLNGQSAPISFQGHTLLHLTPSYTLSGAFTNFTGACIGATGSISVLYANLGVGGISLFDLGPLFEEPFTMSCVGGQLEVFNKTFQLADFNTIRGPTFEVYYGPEPSTGLLAGLGLAILGLWKIRRVRLR